MLKVKEKIAYGLGDTASNIVFQTVMLFLSYFYTDIFGISPAIVGSLFLVVRIFDAVTDPLMGALADRTRTRHGQFRPYLLWLALPFGIISVVAFTTPDLGQTGKIIYAFTTYLLLMIAYTAINIPYSALGGVLSKDPAERVSIQSYRFVFGMLGGLMVTGLTLHLVEYFGEGDNAKGYQLTIALMSVIGIILFLLCFWGTKERVKSPPANTKNLKSNLASLWQNDQWRILSSAAFFLLTGMVLKTTLAIYYVKYYLEAEDMITQFITIGMVGNILGVALAQVVAKKFCKIKAYISLQLISALVCILAFWVPKDDFNTAVTLYFFWGFFLQMATPMLWAKMADCVDYGHWKDGTRLTGLVYSSIVFFIKLGLALGGALAGWLLAYYGYQADQIQAPETQQGIRLAFCFLPAIGSVIVAIIMRSYILDNKKLNEIQAQLG